MASEKKTLKNMLTNSVAVTQNCSCSSGDFLTQIVNIATMCYIPIQCNFVYVPSRMHSCKLTGDVAAVSTITQLYVFATLHLIRKLHPALKNESQQMDAEAIFNKVGDSLKKHVKMAKCCTLSSPPNPV